MIEFQRGNLLEANADALVNTVNCVGVMGKGIALQFKLAYPGNFRVYAKACKAGEVRLGRMLTVPTGQLSSPKYIVNFPTKGHWKAKSRLDDIQTGLRDLVVKIQTLGIQSIAVPPLGCGNGGLDWNDVYPEIQRAFDSLREVRVLLYAPQLAPTADTMPVATPRPRMTRGRAMMVKLIEQYGEPGYSLTKLEMQKIAYFLQVAGEPLKLDFVKHQFGPFAIKLNHVLKDMEGHLTRGYGDGNSQSSINALPGALEEAEAFLVQDSTAKPRLDAVSALICGYESPYGMELLATVHWVLQEIDGELSIEQVTEAVRNWNERKRRIFRIDHIKKAFDRLSEYGLVGQIEPDKQIRNTFPKP